MSANRSFSFVATLALIIAVFAASAAYSGPVAAAAKIPSGEPSAVPLVTLQDGAYGSTIGPGGALYVTQPAAGKIWRVDPKTGDPTLFASDLPTSVVPFGGVVDVAFIGNTAYALVTLVVDNIVPEDPEDALEGAVVGIYKVTGPDSSTVVADIGKFSVNNPPKIPFDYIVPTGVQYALETFRGGFLVTDGHLNRVLRVTLDGEVSEMMQFSNTVPTGLAVHGNTVYMAEAGPIPHYPQDGKVVTFGPTSDGAAKVASGTPLPVDVEFGRGRTLYALSQGDFPEDGNPADPAEENSGALVEVKPDGTFSVVVDGLNWPNSLEFIGNTAYVVTLAGEILEIDGVSGPPFGVSR
jgi:hypothetical protein